MQKAYSRINWENYPSDRTPINETNLNKIDVAMNEVDNRVITLGSTKLDKTDAANLISSFDLDKTTGIITITYLSGAIVTIDTMLEKLAVNFDYDSTTQSLLIILDDGTTKSIDLSELITQYEFEATDTVAFYIANDGKISAVVKDGSIQERHLRPDYLADIKVEVAKAELSENNAESSAIKSESFAIGGTGTRTDEDTDNAKYYYDKSKEIYENFNSAGEVTGVKGSAETDFRIGQVEISAEDVGALPLTGGILSGDLQYGDGKGIYWKEDGYGDKFKIIPSFGGADDSNKLLIQSAIGGEGTDPEPTTKISISGKTGNTTFAGNVKSEDSAGNNERYFEVANNLHDGYLCVSVNGRLGIYSKTHKKWVVKAESTGEVDLNGTANSAINDSLGRKIDVTYIARKNITTDDPLSNYTDVGVYHVINSNQPDNPTKTHGTMYVDTMMAVPYQIFIPDRTLDIYKRRFINGAWEAEWSKMEAGNADSATNDNQGRNIAENITNLINNYNRLDGVLTPSQTGSLSALSTGVYQYWGTYPSDSPYQSPFIVIVFTACNFKLQIACTYGGDNFAYRTRGATDNEWCTWRKLTRDNQILNTATAIEASTSDDNIVGAKGLRDYVSEKINKVYTVPAGETVTINPAEQGITRGALMHIVEGQNGYTGLYSVGKGTNWTVSKIYLSEYITNLNVSGGSTGVKFFNNYTRDIIVTFSTMA